MASSLRELGIEKGSRVVVGLPNGVDLLVVFFAIANRGAIYVPLISGSTTGEAQYVLRHSRADAFLVSPEEASGLDIGNLETSGTRIWFGAEPPEGYLELTEPEGGNGESPALVSADDPMAIMYTSGSTGKPKGVVLPQVSLAKAGYAKADRLSYGPDDVILCVLPLYHVGGLHYCLAPAMARGSKVMFQPKFSVTRFWADVARAGATGGLLMPAMMAMLKTVAPSDTDRENSLETVVSHVVDREFAERFGVDVVTTWSLSESAGIAVYGKRGLKEIRPKMVGWPVGDAEIRVVESAEDGLVDLPRGEVGELAVRHDSVMIEYWDDKAATRDSIRDGWLLSGDLGRMDDRGRIYFEGRVKNMIKRSGENIAAEEVESRLLQHENVVECAVLGVPDEIRTEEVKAFIVVRQETDPLDLTAWCAEALSDFKVPRFIEFIDRLPRNATDKVDRPALIATSAGRATWDRTSAGWATNQI
jgi:crotonobetaine/carnitine-CoA ligase